MNQAATEPAHREHEPGLTLSIGGERVVLHAERAAELPASRIVVIADVHWGKATALRAHGVPVPAGGTSVDLLRLDTLLHRTGAERLLVLGDLAHSRHGWDERAMQPVLAWRRRWPSLRITLVRGNHDAHAGDPPTSLDIDVVDAPLVSGGLAFAHDPDSTASAVQRLPHQDTATGAPYVLCGHLHPTIRLGGRGGDRVRLPCFVLGTRCFILPAFSAFTGGGAWTPREGERAFAIVDEHVLEVPV